MKKFYITTPIYYANGPAHIGHAYTSLLTDIVARSKRLLGYKVKFSTGVDENGQKMLQKAQEEGMDVMEFLDNIASKHIQAWKELRISYTDYIRTTEKRHHEFVQKVIMKCYENGDIYKGKYEGLYCVGCEAFKKKDELTPDGLCPDHLKKPDVVIEENYFFKLSKYQKQIEELYKSHPDFVKPDFRFNEIKAFVERGLEDFSVSRKGNENDFRIKFPLDESHVVYIWFDALFNYITVCQDGDEGFWPADLHVMAKDIIRFHAIYWPAMLMSAGYDLPKNIISHGYFTVDGQKMSKSIGNVVDPITLFEQYGRDIIVFYLFYDIVVGNDGDFNFERFKSMYDSMLLGGWGNLVSRVSNLAAKNGITKGIFNDKKYNELITNTENLFIGKGIKDIYDYLFPNQNIQKYLQEWYVLVQLCNKYMQDNEPWKKIKDENTKEDGLKDLEFLLYMIKQLSIISAPILLEGFEKVQSILGNEKLSKLFSEKESQIDEKILQEIFDMKEFDVNLNPGIIYNRV